MTDSASFVVGPDADPDKYRLLRQVGGGGEAEIWQATVTVAGDGETVAVKILRDVHAVDAAAWQERWSEQVELLRLLRHPGVVGVHEYFGGARMHLSGEADPQTRHHYLVMNWVKGVDLRQWGGDRQGFDRFEALRHLTQVADVLDWLHSGKATGSNRPVVHGDISPGNVIVNSDGQAVLVDFGLFRMAAHEQVPPSGTLGYCAPEVLANGEYGPASDRYGFGALAYFLLTGDKPPSQAQELRAALAERLKPMLGAIDRDALVAIAADEPADRPTAGTWMRTLWPHASTAAPREAPLPPPRPGNEFIPAGRSEPVTAVPADTTATARSGGHRKAPTLAAPIPPPPPPAGAKPRSTTPAWPWVLLASVTAVALVCIVGAAALYTFGDRGSAVEYAPDEERNEPTQPNDQIDLATEEASEVRGFTETYDAEVMYVADCRDDPSVEFIVQNKVSWVEIDATYNGGVKGEESPVTFGLYADDELVDETETEMGDVVLNGSVADAKVVRIAVTGGEVGQCAINSGYLETSR